MIISRTPMRVSFVGGGTDLPGFSSRERGSVVSVAIKKYIYIIVHPSFDKKNLISYSKIEKTDNIDHIQNTRVREAMKMTDLTDGVEIHSIGEVPSGTGLGSSSSFLVGLLNALYAYQGKHVSQEQLAREACEIEINSLKEPIGRQDQYVAAFGGLNKINFLRDEAYIKPIICKKQTLKSLQENLLLFYFGKPREASTILSDQNKEVLEKDEIFSYYLKMRDMSDELESDIIKNDLTRFGYLLHENWLLKKQLANGISNRDIDNYYKIALQSGALGGKLLGAGGGGFLLIYAEKDKHEAIRKNLGKDLQEVPLEFDMEGTKIIYVN
jgi:D-glycero-alpha-D-manno-heptose-7-phosphate kinase